MTSQNKDQNVNSSVYIISSHCLTEVTQKATVCISSSGTSEHLLLRYQNAPSLFSSTCRELLHFYQVHLKLFVVSAPHHLSQLKAGAARAPAPVFSISTASETQQRSAAFTCPQSIITQSYHKVVLYVAATVLHYISILLQY